MPQASLAIGGTGERVPISLGDGDRVQWALAYGTDPVIGEIETDRTRAQLIYEQSGGSSATESLSIFLRPSQGRDRKFAGVYALAIKAGRNSQRRRIVIADRRYWWRYKLIDRAYNVRRNTGDFRLVAGAMQQVPANLLQAVADVDYRKVSLQDNLEPHTALTALEDLMQELDPGAFSIPEGVASLTDFADGVTLRDRGNDALKRLLAFLPGIQPLVLESGLVTFRNQYDQTERLVATQFFDRKSENGGSVTTVSRAASRPPLFKVHFLRELELRCDFEDRGGEVPPSVGTLVGGGDRDPAFENVIPCPLYRLPLAQAAGQVGVAAGGALAEAGVPGGAIATQGDWLPLPIFLQALSQLAAQKGTPGSSLGLTNAMIRECWLGKWQALADDFTQIANGRSYDPELRLMVNALQQHWRQTFRISPDVMSKVRGLSATRVGLVDPESGTRARAQVFCDWVEKIALEGLYRAGTQKDLAIRHPDWAADLGSAKVAPFDVQILDSDVGIFTIVPRVHQGGLASDYVIGDAEGNLPKLALSTFINAYHQVTMKDEFRCSVVLSAVQDSPNDSARLHVEEVTPEQAAEVLGVLPPTQNLGPTLELFVGLDTARHAWIDSRRREILDGLSGASGQVPADLIVNRAAIRSLAEAAAASALAPYLDRVQGQLTVSHAPAVEPTGNLTQVVHTFENTGNGVMICRTQLLFPGVVEAPAPGSLVPEELRRQIRGQVQL